VKAPLLLWGPYLWADGTTPRKADGLVWERDDLAGDGTHPSQSGRRKVADQLLKFVKTDPLAATWFVKR
jgi:lysophospholipase L1-like esterase